MNKATDQNAKNSQARPVFHGSDIEKICAVYHLKKEEIVNFGSNVNPLGLSEAVKKEASRHLDLFSTYPDRNYTQLREAISSYCDIPPSFLLTGNGSSELISLLIRVIRPKKALILGPTYSEYSRELSLTGSTQEYYHLQEARNFTPDFPDLFQTLGNGYDLLILCNPNNPTSSAILRDDLDQLLAFCQKKNIFVMIDETYVEFAPSVEDITAIPLTRRFSNLIVLRGVSKFFAAPGMRLGYGISGNQDILEQMREEQIPWSLNSLGAYAGALMFCDQTYIQNTRNLILSQREWIQNELSQIPDFCVYPAYANFFLLKIKKEGLTSADVFEQCIQNGLMIRDCSSFQCLEGEYIRFCIQMPEDNARLLKVLRSIQVPC